MTWILLVIIALVALFSVPVTRPYAQRAWSVVSGWRPRWWMVVIAILAIPVFFPSIVPWARAQGEKVLSSWSGTATPSPSPTTPAPKQEDSTSKQAPTPSPSPSPTTPDTATKSPVTGPPGPKGDPGPQGPKGDAAPAPALKCGTGTVVSNGQCVAIAPENKMLVGLYEIDDITSSEAVVRVTTMAIGSGKFNFSLMYRHNGAWEKFDYSQYGEGSSTATKRLTGLTPSATYEVKVVYGDKDIATKTFTTKPLAAIAPKQDPPAPEIKVGFTVSNGIASASGSELAGKYVWYEYRPCGDTSSCQTQFLFGRVSASRDAAIQSRVLSAGGYVRVLIEDSNGTIPISAGGQVYKTRAATGWIANK